MATVLAIAGIVCVGFGARAVPEPASAPPRRSGPALATPLWSPRRVPALFAAAVATVALQRQLAAIVAPYSGCVVVDGPAGELARIRPDTPLAGASTQKLLIAAAALAELGASHRFATRAVTDARLRSGVLEGDLTIVGGGDPMLSTSDAPSTATAPNTSLSALADAIVRAGVKRINGALVADDSRYDRERAVPDWKPSEIAEGDVGALGALIVNGGRGDNGLASSDPALQTVQALSTLLSARGVEVAGGATDPGRAAGRSERAIAEVRSPPLSEIVEQMLTVSNDETAELLTRELGVARLHSGTTAAGTRAIPLVLAVAGVPITGVLLHDGSGLAPDDRVTCAALRGVVALGEQPRFASVLAGLAIAGQTGTLAGRLVGTTLAGRVHAKTGHIDGVVGLAGVIERTPASGTPNGASNGGVQARFAFVANGEFSTTVGETMQDRVAEAIGAYVDAPAALGPVPSPRRILSGR